MHVWEPDNHINFKTKKYLVFQLFEALKKDTKLRQSFKMVFNLYTLQQMFKAVLLV